MPRNLIRNSSAFWSSNMKFLYRRWVRIYVFLLLLIFFPAVSVLAQDTRGVPVTEKSRPDYDAQGIRAGAFIVKPELKLGTEYNDNIYATKSSKKSDWITTVAPKVDVRSNWTRHSLGLNAGLKGGIYSSESDENYIDGHIFLDGRMDILRESFLSANAGFQRLHEERGSPDSVGAWKEPAVYYRTTGGLAYYHGIGKVSVSTGVDIVNLDYSRVKLDAGGSDKLRDRDRNTYTVMGRIAYELTPDVQPFITARYNWRNYEKKDRNFDEKRDSEGYRIGVGTGFDLGGVTSGEIFAGYMNQDYDNIKDISGFWYGMNLLWNVTEMTSIQANVLSSVKETTSADASGIDGVDAGIRIDHELLRNLLVGAFFDYTHDSYKGISRTDKSYSVGPRLTYLWNRNFSAEASYKYRKRESNRADNYTENRFSIALTGKF
jgi:hypothetical protein